jgi:predicted 3-demethylubiquinone-9 3-methyltransferase (glyoxalase superfamily)
MSRRLPRLRLAVVTMNNPLLLIAAGLLLGLPYPMLDAGAASRGSLDPLTPRAPMLAPQKIATCLWFDRNAEEAVRFYVSLFENSKVLAETRWGDGGPVPKGTLMSARFQLEGREFVALNGGPTFRLTEAASLLVSCETQKEVDDLWDRLGAGGEPSQCGWLKDRFGLSWQVVPRVLEEMLQDPDDARRKRVFAAMLPMKKLDIAKLQQAYDQKQERR